MAEKIVALARNRRLWPVWGVIALAALALAFGLPRQRGQAAETVAGL